MGMETSKDRSKTVRTRLKLRNLLFMMITGDNLETTKALIPKGDNESTEVQHGVTDRHNNALHLHLHFDLLSSPRDCADLE